MSNPLEEVFKEYQQSQSIINKPFLLFEMDNANENAHTRFLERLLKITDNGGKYMILASFLRQIGLPEQNLVNPQVEITTQKQAIGPKATGFIDLYIQYQDQSGQTIKVIIENKVKKADDCYQQLARYIATAAGVKAAVFNSNDTSWYNRLDYIYVIYLSYSANEEPSEDSLPSALKGKLEGRYRHINYQDDILPWLESELRYIPIGINGTIASGVHQYMEYLKWYYGTAETWTPKNGWDFLIDATLSDAENYKQIGKMIDETNLGDSLEAKDFMKLVEQEREGIFAKDCDKIADGEWTIHYTPSFVCLFKKSWANADTRKYSIPSVYFCVQNTNFVSDTQLSWDVYVDHLTADPKLRSSSNRYPDKLFNNLQSSGVTMTFVNHDKTAVSNLSASMENSQPMGSLSKQDRQVAYSTFLQLPAVSAIVAKIDRCICQSR